MSDKPAFTARVAARDPSCTGPAAALVLAFAAERDEVAQAENDIEQLRGAIAQQDTDIEALRAELSAFAARFEHALAHEHALEARVRSLLHYVDRLAACVQSEWSARERRAEAQRLEHARRQQVVDWHTRRLHTLRQAPHPDHAAQAVGPHEAHAEGDEQTHGASPANPREQAKVALRQLARRYHPDLAPNERVRAQHSERMAEINRLFAQGAWSTLQAMAQRLEATREALWSSSPTAPDWPKRCQAAQKSLRRHWAIFDALRDEHQQLLQSEVYALRQAVHAQRRTTPRDPFFLLRQASIQRARHALTQVPLAFASLEEALHALRQKHRRAHALQIPEASGALAHAFDATPDHAFCRLGLQALRQRDEPAAVAALAAELVAHGRRQPAVGRLLFFAYVAQLCPQPLESLASFAALAQRFESLGARDEKPVHLAEALVQSDALVGLRVGREADGQSHLRFVLRGTRFVQAVPAMLCDIAMRRLFAQVLSCLGDATKCPTCRRQVFCVPLFWLQGIDPLRALLCPRCGHVFRRYVMARGDDVQALLNRAYLDFDLVAQVRIGIARRVVALQLLPQQRAVWTVAMLAERVRLDLLARNGLRIGARALRLSQRGVVLPPSTLLARLADEPLRLQFGGEWTNDEQRVCDELLFRVRTRYEPAKI